MTLKLKTQVRPPSLPGANSTSAMQQLAAQKAKAMRKLVVNQRSLLEAAGARADRPLQNPLG